MTIREGRWDCRTCDKKGNRGPDSYCGSCGSPRPDDVEFYLTDDAVEVTDEKLIAEAESGADWKCSYCTTQNNAFDNFCVSCGHRHNTEGGDSFLQEKDIRLDSEGVPAQNFKGDSNSDQPVQKKGISRKLKITVLSVVSAILLFIGLSMITSEVKLTVTALEYNAKISFDEYKLVTEEDWSLPAGAEKLNAFTAVHHYDKVPDGYETKTRQVQVKIGEKKVRTGSRDMGNGYFKDIYETKPVYETRTETYRETKYRDVPVYRTKYRYRMMKWVTGAPLEIKGIGKDNSYTDTVDEMNRNGSKYRNVKPEIKWFITAVDDNGKSHREDVKQETWDRAGLNGTVTGEKSAVFGVFYRIKE